MPQSSTYRALLLGLLCTSASVGTFGDEKTSISDLKWTDKQYMEAQAQRVDALAREEFGSQLHATKNDLELLQRIINRGLVERTDTQTQQALGIVLGNVLASETGMQWFIYNDAEGRSRALCVTKTEHCLFPATMLSRRMAAGLYPDVAKIYNDALEMVEPHIHQSPYDAK